VGDLLGRHGSTAAQLLLTLNDLEDRRRYLNATATLAGCSMPARCR
jgi:glutamate 5-kinase